MPRSGKNKDQAAPEEGESSVEPTADDAVVDQTPENTPALNPSIEYKSVSGGDDISLEESTADVPRSTRSGIIGTSGILIGGIFAAAIGFLAAQYSANDRWPFPADNSVTDELVHKIAGLENTINEQQLELQKLTSELASKSSSNDLAGLSEVIRETNEISVSISNDLADLASRLTDVENRPIPEPGADQDAVDYYVQELAAMRAMLNDELAKITECQETVTSESIEVAELAKSNSIQQAVSQTQIAAESGMPFHRQLEKLKAAGLKIDPNLVVFAEVGIPTIAALSDEFPPAARQALASSVSNPSPDSNNGGRVVSFLRDQLGIRSLEPKPGESVDAILSRAEAAVSANDIDLALKELDALPEISGREMHKWIDRASQRQAAMQLVSALKTPVSE